jgi:hypothetical protein
MQHQAMGKPAAAGLGFAAYAPAGSVDPATVYVAAPGTELRGSGEAGPQRMAWLHSRTLLRVRSAEGRKANHF